MDEVAVADIDADMAEGAAHGVEEHQITGLEFVLVDFLRGLCLLVSAARQDLAQGFGVDGADEAAAVEAGLGTVAAAAVGNADEAHGDRKSTRLNSSHANISYAVFCLEKKKYNRDEALYSTI